MAGFLFSFNALQEIPIRRTRVSIANPDNWTNRHIDREQATQIFQEKAANGEHTG